MNSTDILRHGTATHESFIAVCLCCVATDFNACRARDSGGWSEECCAIGVSETWIVRNGKEKQRMKKRQHTFYKCCGPEGVCSTKESSNSNPVTATLEHMPRRRDSRAVYSFLPSVCFEGRD
jgi:hypothetical protein